MALNDRIEEKFKIYTFMEKIMNWIKYYMKKVTSDWKVKNNLDFKIFNFDLLSKHI